MGKSKLSAKTVAILELIAKGHTYDQIVQALPDVRHHHVFAAADEALQMNSGQAVSDERMQAIRKKYPRAYEKWPPEEDQALQTLHREGKTPQEIADILQRQPTAIQSRLLKLGLVTVVPPPERG